MLPINWFFSSSWNSIWTANNNKDNNVNNNNNSNKNKNNNNYNRITAATTNTKSIAATNSSTDFISKSFLEQTKQEMERAWYFEPAWSLSSLFRAQPEPELLRKQTWFSSKAYFELVGGQTWLWASNQVGNLGKLSILKFSTGQYKASVLFSASLIFGSALGLLHA